MAEVGENPNQPSLLECTAQLLEVLRIKLSNSAPALDDRVIGAIGKREAGPLSEGDAIREHHGGTFLFRSW
jgi:hypothetical protein